jgi:TetR/AcrR family transcriptional regulator, mexCD-oprJ operon repressor
MPASRFTDGRYGAAVTATDHRRATAERNVEAILDAASELLESGRQPSISAVAGQAGVSRVTVYAHFQDLEQLIEALVERAVLRAEASIEAAEPGRGPADEALRRVIQVSWDELGRHHAIGQAAAAGLSSAAIHRSHESAARQIRKLVERGRREKVFRTDVSPSWLVASYFALVHAARDEVLAGRSDRKKALRDLEPTLLSLFKGEPK